MIYKACCTIITAKVQIGNKSYYSPAKKEVYLMNFIGAAVTDVGTVKPVNQDSLTLKIANSSRGTVCLAVICDGLGGLQQGEVASGNVILAFDKWFREDFLKSDYEWTAEQVRGAWEDIVFTMNKKIKEHGIREGVELGTTLTAILFVRDQYYIIHVGDSRIYELSNVCRQLTKDQTLIAQEIERGALTPEQALTDSRRNVLLQCIGVTENLVPEFLSGNTIGETTYLLCTDGFRHVISEGEIYQYCRAEENATQEAMHNHLYSLTELIKQRGERDNISAVLVKIGM